MTNLKTALWCDLTTDAERSAWLLLGRGYETGVVAKSMQSDLARAYQRLAQNELDAVLAEREACALFIESIDDENWYMLQQYDLVDAIRTRGQQ